MNQMRKEKKKEQIQCSEEKKCLLDRVLPKTPPQHIHIHTNQTSEIEEWD